MSKGSMRRPRLVDSEKFSNNWDSIFKGLSKIWQATKDHATGAITACRSDNDKSTDILNNKKLFAALKFKGFNTSVIDGTYIENFNSDDAMEVSEYTFFVVNPEEGDDHGYLEDILIGLGKMFGQDSILSCQYGGDPTLIGTSDNPKSYPGLGNREVYTNRTWGKVPGQFYSKVKGRPFGFSESMTPQTINGKRVMYEWGKTIIDLLEQHENI